jgi:regulatory protein YycH of two-component signal transduction system YycFG
MAQLKSIKWKMELIKRGFKYLYETSAWIDRYK